MKFYTIRENKNNNNKNIIHLNQGTCKDACQTLEELVDPSLMRFEGEEFKFQSNSKKYISILCDMLKTEQNRVLSISDNYKMRGGRIV